MLVNHELNKLKKLDGVTGFYFVTGFWYQHMASQSSHLYSLLFLQVFIISVTAKEKICTLLPGRNSLSIRFRDNLLIFTFISIFILFGELDQIICKFLFLLLLILVLLSSFLWCCKWRRMFVNVSQSFVMLFYKVLMLL